MGFQSIFAWKALPEAAFVNKTVIDAHRSKHESIASGWLHRSARPILPQASTLWKVWNLPDCFLRARESVRRASGFVQTGLWEVIAMFSDECPRRGTYSKHAYWGGFARTRTTPPSLSTFSEVTAAAKQFTQVPADSPPLVPRNT
jgi:hypothetical protein